MIFESSFTHLCIIISRLSKESVVVGGPFWHFVTKVFYGEALIVHAQPPRWGTTTCWLSATAYSIYSQLPSISGGRFLYPQSENAPCSGDKGGFIIIFLIIFLMGWDWVHLVLRPLFGILYQPQMIDDDDNDDCGPIGGGNRSTRTKHSPVQLCPLQIPHDLTRARTRAATVASRRLTAWAMARPRQGGIVWTGFTWLWIGASGGALVNTVMNAPVPQND
jgi:hypothetical protein